MKINSQPGTTHADTREIAVIGYSCRFPQAADIGEYWRNLVTGKDSIRSLPHQRAKEIEKAMGRSPGEDFIKAGYLDSISRFEPAYFGISEEESRYIDPQHRLLLELVEEALQDAGRGPESLNGENVGVFIASEPNEYGRLVPLNSMGFVNGQESSAAGRISYTYNFTGPSVTISTACSSSLSALHYAMLCLRNRQCRYAVVAAARIKLFPAQTRFLQDSPILSSSMQIRTFDKDADGTMEGEGGGALIITTRENANLQNETIRAFIRGTGINSNGRRANGMSAPSPEAQSELIARTLEQTVTDPETVSYFEAHGTGTPLGDPIEVEAIARAFKTLTQKKQYIPIGSVKTNIGHLNSAAGMAGLIKVILAMEHKKIPPSLNYKEPNPYIDFKQSPVYVAQTLQDWKSTGPRRACVNSLGLTGTNTVAVLEEAQPVSSPDHPDPPPSRTQIITLSARTQSSFTQITRDLIKHLGKNPHLRLADIAGTLNTGRRHFPLRAAVIAKDTFSLEEKLESLTPVSLPRNLPAFNPVFIYLPPDTPGEDYYRFQFTITGQLKKLGFPPAAALGIGSGNEIVKAVTGKTTLDCALVKAQENAPGDNSSPPDNSRLQNTLDAMLEKNYSLFFTIGQKNAHEKKIRTTLENKGKNILYINIEDSETSFYQALAELYINGAHLNWDSLYPGNSVKKVRLPAYPFDRGEYFPDEQTIRNSIRQQVEMFNTGTTGESLEKAPAAGETGKENPVNHQEILGIFKRFIPGSPDPRLTFLDNGADSITVLEVVEEIKKKYHHTVPMDMFYKDCRMEELTREIVQRIKNDNHRETLSPPASSPTVPRSPAPECPPASVSLSLETVPPGKILLTGGTGFLGIHVLHQLLQQTQSHVVMIIREKEQQDPEARFRETWRYYFSDPGDTGILQRVQIVSGDLTAPGMGLTPGTYRQLAQTVDTVVHCAADVRHYGPDSHFRAINVEAVRKIIGFCRAQKPKILHHSSTYAVSGVPGRPMRFRETDFDIGQDFNGQVYQQTKYEAEKLVREEIQDGLNAAVYRVGSLAGRFSDGLFQRDIESNLFYNRLKAIIDLGKIPASFARSRDFELTPVDACAAAMVNLMKLKGAPGHTFHLLNPNFVSPNRVIDFIRRLGHPLEEVEDAVFNEYVREQVQIRRFSRELSRIFYALPDDPGTPGTTDTPMVEYDTGFSGRVLAEAAFTWPELTFEYFQKIVRHCWNRNYIAPPVQVKHDV